MSTLLLCGGRSTVCRATPPKRLFSRPLSSPSRAKRTELLKQIYAPVTRLEKGSSEYDAIAASGKCWSDYFDPGNMDRYGFKGLEKAHRDLLVEIDSYRGAINMPIERLAKMLVNEYAHQSTAIEDNRLQLGESLLIADSLADKFFQRVDMPSVPTSDLATMPLPPTGELLPEQDSSQVAEIRNHIIATQWVAEVAPMHPGTAGLTLRFRLGWAKSAWVLPKAPNRS
ncbi:hypothetical protein FQN55_003416 [Onygenales sp. PD_40]|nr:hypothetical protein FQN55_003416 [Onygenales sp. PD_40]